MPNTTNGTKRGDKRIIMLSLEKKTISDIRKIAQDAFRVEPFLHKLYAVAPPRPIESRTIYRRYMKILEFCLTISQEEEFPEKLLKPVRHYAAIVSMLISDYERKHFKLPKSSQSEILNFLMKQHDLTQTDLAADMGGQPAVSNVLNGKRKLNFGQIAKLSRRFHVSPATFYSDVEAPNQSV